MRTTVPSGLWAVCVVAVRNSRKLKEGSWTWRDIQSVLSLEVIRELSSLDAFALMSRSRMDERFWYNCKQGLDCSRGDIQVISREVDDKFLEI